MIHQSIRTQMSGGGVDGADHGGDRDGGSGDRDGT